MACATTIGLPAVSDDIDSTDAEFTVWDGIGQSNLMGFGTQVINGKGPLAIWRSGKGLRIGFDAKI